MNSKSLFWGIFFSIIMSALIFFLGYGYDRVNNTPKELYQVYLDGKVVGVINNETELYNLIDKEQETLKSDYNVDKIYPPNNLEVSKVVTFKDEVTSAKDIYERIKDKEPFTIKGYEVTIEKTAEDAENIKLYILNKDDLNTAVNNTIKIFVDEKTYEAYLNGTQETKFEEGSILEKVSIDEKITIKETFIPTEEKIFATVEELSRYMLFGKEESNLTYTIKAGDTIKSVANANSLSVTGFLMVNPEINGENSLIFPGQVVSVDVVNPIITIVTESTLIENQSVNYETQVEYDNSMVYGTTLVKQAGVKGVNKVTFRTESRNGAITSVVRTTSEEISPVIDEIIVKGGINIIYVGDSTYWAWPTLPGYLIMDYYGWRIDPVWGGSGYHYGIDISGTGHGSPIFAIQNGTVIDAGYGDSTMGNYIYINHNNGYISVYMHLSDLFVSTGQTVIKGDTIGTMGSTGKSTGTHLHLGVYYGDKARDGVTSIDPFELYK